MSKGWMMSDKERDADMVEMYAVFAELDEVEAAYARGFKDGYATGLAEARAHGALMVSARIVVSMAVQHFGQGCVVRLLEDGQLHVEATSEKNASLDAQIEFMRDLREIVGDREIVVTARAPGYEPTALDRIAIERGVMLT